MGKSRLQARAGLLALATALISLGATLVAGVVPNEIQMPGTQPGEGPFLFTSDICRGCHSGLEEETEPWATWDGSMMAHAARDPVFWAAMAVAEQDFDGSGDLCLRCHTPQAWLEGRSTPTNGSALLPTDFDGVSCHLCHTLTNPDNSEYLGVQNAPFEAHNGAKQPTAYRGSGMYVLWLGSEILGPYSNPAAAHGWLPSQFHRSSDLCGTCHDVSNPLVGDLAPGNGAATPLAPGTFSGVLGAAVEDKAAFNNFPHAYGVVERTFSEHVSTPLTEMPVSALPTLPVELKAGALDEAYDAAMASTPDGNYVDGTQRNFTCQSCHMPPAKGLGCNLPFVPERDDLPVHDLTGGNYWAPDAILHLDGQNRLVGGNGLDAEQIAGIIAGRERARANLREAGSLALDGNVLEVFNLTGHKLITGYPEGRRMWLRTRWYDAGGGLLREDGEYGQLNVTHDGGPLTVETILDLSDPYTRIYKVQPGVSQEWAQKLLSLGTSPSLALDYDRTDGSVTETLGGLAASAAGTIVPAQHFVLNDKVISDNRIPPYQMDYDSAAERNALPVPETQFGNPGPGGAYEHWDEFQLTPPAGAVRARIELLYQPISWEYIQFLDLANDGSVANLASTGQDLLDAWLATGMAAPEVMAEVDWGLDAPRNYCTAKVNSLGCTPRMGSTGVPSASLDNGFQVTARDIRNNREGVLAYTVNGPKAVPFQGGTLCIKGPLRRTPKQSSGGSPAPANDCTGSFSLDFNERIASGVDPNLMAGQSVWMQYWSRDLGSPFGTNLTDAMFLTIQP